MFLDWVCGLMLLLQSFTCSICVIVCFAEGKVWLFSINCGIQHQIKFLIGQGKLNVLISFVGGEKNPKPCRLNVYLWMFSLILTLVFFHAVSSGMYNNFI